VTEKQALSEQVNRILQQQYERLDQAGDIEISPALVAAHGYEEMDPEAKAPTLVQYVAQLQLRQQARYICRKRVGEEDDTSNQTQMFDEGLQPRYPAIRNGEEVYVKREHLTLHERKYNIGRLRNEGESKVKHAIALEAETNMLIARGDFGAVA
jgi:hypothetical protein